MYNILQSMKKKTEYNHLKIEPKWQKEWESKKIYKTEDASSKKKPYYVLDMFPYPSGSGLHVGHPRGYIGSDVFARFKRMQGFNVLHPMGFDAFGLPAEQYAIQTGKHPSIITKSAIKRYKKQLEQIGFSYDWKREVQTIDPEYYKWTQFIFLKIYNSFFDIKKQKARHIDELIKVFEKEGNAKANDYVAHTEAALFSKTDWKNFSPKEKQDILMKYRLAYEGYAEVNWSKDLGTVLANDEVIEKNGLLVSERGEFPVERKSMRQWFMRISAYGDRLISGLEDVDFEESTKETQKNWIGKSEGAEVSFPIAGKEESVKVYTTRIDTIFSGTFIVLSPEHSFLLKHKDNLKNKIEINNFLLKVKNKTEEERVDKDNKFGVCLEDIFAINPATEEKIPVWVSDFVLGHYGTGAVFADAHDKRDFDMAKKYNIPLKISLKPLDTSIDFEKIKNLESCYEGEGTLVNSQQFDNMSSDTARPKIIEWLSQKGFAKKVVKYKMRDAIFARQRYWGEPIPLIHDKKTGLIKEVPLSKLPLKLPNVQSYKPTGTGESPLASVKSWKDSGYETNTMPGWAGSSWYFLRYMDPQNKKALAGEKAIQYWKNVDMYVGGTEHNTGHLLYARFWHKVLFDLGIAKTEEPFKALRHQGMIGGADGRKMSKRWGNVVNPDDVVLTYGADTLRVFEMFLGPFDAHLPWSEDGIIGSRRFIERVYRLLPKLTIMKSHDLSYEVTHKALHKTIKKVTEDIQSFGFNTAVSSMMILLNEFEKVASVDTKDFKHFLQILAPFAPYVTDELWTVLGEKKSIHLSTWPKFDPKKIVEHTKTIGVQINGKVRGEVTIDLSMSETEVRQYVLEDSTIKKYLDKPIKKFIYIQGKIISIVL